MILPDVNVLVFAFRREVPEHERTAAWLLRAAADDGLALAEPVLTGLIRIVTHPRVFATPAPTPEAVGYVRSLLDAPRSTRLVSTDATWSTFEALAREDRGLRGNVVPDAWLAALALSHGCVLATADRGFARFPGLRTVDPSR